MTSEQVGGIVRTLVAAFGGYFAGKGYFDAEMVTAVAGAASTIAIAIWSIASKQPPKV